MDGDIRTERAVGIEISIHFSFFHFGHREEKKKNWWEPQKNSDVMAKNMQIHTQRFCF